MKVNIDFYTDYELESKKKEYNEFLEKYQNKIKDIVLNALILNDIDINNVYLGIGIVTPKRIQELNKDFRNVDSTTDVLSFPMYEKEELRYIINCEEEISIGDIVICMEVIEKQAEEYGTGFNREMLYMVTHGICHLLGYDHIKKDDKIEMRDMEEKILLKVGEI